MPKPRTTLRFSLAADVQRQCRHGQRSKRSQSLCNDTDNVNSGQNDVTVIAIVLTTLKSRQESKLPRQFFQREQ